MKFNKNKKIKKIKTEEQAINYVKGLIFFSPVHFNNVDDYIHHFKRRYVRMFNRIPPDNIIEIANLLKGFK